MPNSFSLTASTEFLQGTGLEATRPDQACTITIGSDLVVTGWIDRRSISLDARNHTVTIMGRGMTRSLADCSVDLLDSPAIKGGTISATNTSTLAQALAAAYGVTCRSAVADLGVAVPSLRVSPGETPMEAIESVARYAGFLLYEDENGALILDRIGTDSMASGFTVPGNIEAISAERSVDARYSDYVVLFGGIERLVEVTNGQYLYSIAKDKTVSQKRVLILVSEQSAPVADPAQNYVLSSAIAQVRANWEFARRLGRSQAASITCDSWRDSAGKLWTPNWLASVEAKAADIDGANWIIGTVTFRKDMSGTHADLVLMPPDAFSPSPDPLNLFDNELANSPRNPNPRAAVGKFELGAAFEMNSIERRVATLEQAIDRLMRRKGTPFALAKSTVPAVDTGVVQTMQAQLDSLTVGDNIPSLGLYGFTSSPPVGADLHICYLNGDRSQAVVVAHNHQTYRLTGLAPRDAAVYAWGFSVWIQVSGIAISGNVALTGNLTVTGSITATGSIIAGHGGGDQVGLQTHEHTANNTAPTAGT